MAALFHAALEGTVSIQIVLDWLLNRYSEKWFTDSISVLLIEKEKFVPYLINYLRDETSWLLHELDKDLRTPPHSKTPTRNRFVVPTQTFNCRNDSSKVRQGLFASPTTKSMDVDDMGCRLLPSTPNNKQLFAGQTSDKPSKSVSFQEELMNVPTPGQVRRLDATQAHHHSSSTSKRNTKLTLSDFLTPQVKNKPQKYENSSRKTPRRVTTSKLGPVTKTNNVTLLSSSTRSDSTFKDGKGRELLGLSVANIHYKSQVDTLAGIYAALLKHNLIPNISVELYFLLQLLCASTNGQHQNNTENHGTLFINTTTCVYFSVMVLSNSRFILRVMDEQTLLLLYQSKRITTFDPYFADEILSVRNDLLMKYVLCTPSSIYYVYYMSDRDGSANFTDKDVFHKVQKARKMFYEILHEYKENHGRNNWSYELAFSKRIRFMLGQVKGSEEQFCSLFVEQLLVSSSLPENEQEQSKPYVWSDYQRNKRLELHKIEGPCPEPQLSNEEIFFSKFATVASYNEQFMTHLQRTLEDKLTEMNRYKLPVQEDIAGISSNNRQESSRSKFQQHLSHMCVMARFLGYIIFVVCGKDGKVCSLNLVDMLQDCVRDGRMVLTVSWLAEYLAWMKAYTTSFQLEYAKLVNIYKLHLSNKWICQLNQLYITVKLGWLFDNAQITNNLFFLLDTGERREEESYHHCSRTAFDHIDLVDIAFIHKSCPYLKQGVLPLLSLKKYEFSQIHPVPSTSIGGSKKLEVSKIEEEVESLEAAKAGIRELFFATLSPSIKQCVEFVVDQISSSCIKEMAKQQRDVYRSICEEIDAQYVNGIKEENRVYLEGACACARSAIIKSYNNLMYEKVTLVLSEMLATELKDKDKHLCFSIGKGLIMNRLSSFIKSNYTLEKLLMFKKVFGCYNAMPRSSRPVDGAAKEDLHSSLKEVMRIDDGFGPRGVKEKDLIPNADDMDDLCQVHEPFGEPLDELNEVFEYILLACFEAARDKTLPMQSQLLTLAINCLNDLEICISHRKDRIYPAIYNAIVMAAEFIVIVIMGAPEKIDEKLLRLVVDLLSFNADVISIILSKWSVELAHDIGISESGWELLSQLLHDCAEREFLSLTILSRGYDSIELNSSRYQKHVTVRIMEIYTSLCSKCFVNLNDSFLP